jgi:hypothetical protein
MALDERMGVDGPEPTGQPLFFRTELLPATVTNERGQVVSARLWRADGSAAPPGDLDRRFVGRLAGEHVLTLHFPEPLDARPGRPLLVADGWVEYPYSQTLFAAWQAGASYDAPTLEARGADGVWRAVAERFGYPAGMPRRMALPLDRLPPGTRTLRLRTNLEVYWDRIAVAHAEAPPELNTRQLPLRDARLRAAGFPRRSDAAQRRPHYDYERRSPFWDTRHMAGLYTRFGPITELVADYDDAVAVFGAGEEAHLEFAADAPDPPAGWRRYLVLETRGWTKDMDLYTGEGETVEPLPQSGAASPRREELHAAYNTRHQAGR